MNHLFATLVMTSLIFVPVGSVAMAGSGNCSHLRITSVVNAAAKAWINQDWKAMYNLLSLEDKRSLSYTKFQKKRVEIASIAKLIAYRITVIECPQNGIAFVDLTLTFMKSPDSRAIWGGNNWYKEGAASTWTLIRENGAWRVKLRAHLAQQKMQKSPNQSRHADKL